jgi:carboxypeptidase Q
MLRTLRSAAATLLLLTTAATASAQVDQSVNLRIRDEGLNRSQIPELARHLTDVIGPRLTGSTGMRRGNDWAAATLRGWGLQNVSVEPWGEFGRGWERVSFSARMLEPFVQPLLAQPVAWTGSTPGPVTGEAVLLRPDVAADTTALRGRLRGALVLMEPPMQVEPGWEPVARRFREEELRDDPPGARPEVAPEVRARLDAEAEARREAQAARAAIYEFLRREGVAAVLNPSHRPYGILRVGGLSAARRPGTDEPLPELVLTHEQYGQIWRNLERGVTVRLEVDVRNRFLDDDLQEYNTLGEIAGSDRAGEVVMIGAHLDSWHTGTGATDNAAGSVVMMEAMRILRALDLQPRRTIRIALWSGEEQGLLGSRAWVENNPDEWPRISAYLNVDNGTGRLRGIWNQGNRAATPVFREILEPFRDLGVVGVRDGNTGGTDHLAFDRAGLPGFNFIQDPIEYFTRTHHTHVDTFERLLLDDLRQAAVIVASTAYHLAMREEMMPRKPAAGQE